MNTMNISTKKRQRRQAGILRIHIAIAKCAAALTWALLAFAPRVAPDADDSLGSLIGWSIFAEASGTASAATSSAASAPYYQSVTALDKYGSSPQIRNAREASSRHGALVVSAVSSDGTIVVCSLSKPRIGVRQHPRPLSGGASFLGGGHAVKVVATGDEGSAAMTTAVVCSGVKSDATLLVSLLRSYARRVWDRYDAVPGADRIADAASEAFLTFMGYDRSKEVLDGAGHACEDEGGEDDFGMSRPFGIQALIIGVGPSGAGGSRAAIRSVDPSGVTGSWVARALGRGSSHANKLLSQRWRRDLSDKETVEMCIDIVREVISKEAEDDSKFDDNSTEIICETLSTNGLLVEVLPFRNKIS
uniref:Proteasome endopeptidase complex n=1 Tax=Odontella aurita TaxID=265563 RepID=A0A7S4ND30_9STRA|mmetsp:Transcript_57779/g.172458  ORF Transcript_57779/g.172458 Transcript_57779/m.172458 type:complete len:361 (+) Transcript_57779:154-1236(+)